MIVTNISLYFHFQVFGHFLYEELTKWLIKRKRYVQSKKINKHCLFSQGFKKRKMYLKNANGAFNRKITKFQLLQRHFFNYYSNMSSFHKKLLKIKKKLIQGKCDLNSKMVLSVVKTFIKSHITMIFFAKEALLSSSSHISILSLLCEMTPYLSNRLNGR